MNVKSLWIWISLMLIVSIYGIRTYRANIPEKVSVFIQNARGEEILHPRIVDRLIVKPHQERLKQHLYTLLIYTDLEQVCAGLLNESTYWLEAVYGDQRLDGQAFLLLPDDTDPIFLDEFIKGHGFPREHILFFDRHSHESQFTKMGVFKVLYSQDKGVVFHERGTEIPDLQRSFGRRIAQLVRAD